MRLTGNELAAIRITGTGIGRPFDTVMECVESLLGIQAQVQQAAEINIFNRVRDISDMEEKFRDGRIIKIWGHRMTVHLHSSEDWETITHLHGYRNNYVRRGWSDKMHYYDAVMSELRRLLEKGEVPKGDIARMIERVAGEVKDPYRDQSIVRQATLDGLMYGVPEKPNIRTFRHRNLCGITEDRFGRWGVGGCREHLQKSMLRYFRFYGPATLADYCHWTGLSRREVAEAFDGIRDRLRDITTDGKKFHYPADEQLEVPDVSGSLHMLGKFDALMLSYADKSWIAPDQKALKAVWRPAAHVEAVVLHEGRLIATWRYVPKGRHLDFNIEPVATIPARVRKMIAKETERLCGFLGKPPGSISYEK